MIKMIFESFYSQANFNNKDYFLVQVSRTKPKNFEVDYKFRSVIPLPYLIRAFKDGIINKREFRLMYNQYLHINKNKILKEWNKIKTKANNKKIVLLCYEKKEKDKPCFCHRFLLKKFLEEIENLCHEQR